MVPSPGAEEKIWSAKGKDSGKKKKEKQLLHSSWCLREASPPAEASCVLSHLTAWLQVSREGCGCHSCMGWGSRPARVPRDILRPRHTPDPLQQFPHFICPPSQGHFLLTSTIPLRGTAAPLSAPSPGPANLILIPTPGFPRPTPRHQDTSGVTFGWCLPGQAGGDGGGGGEGVWNGLLVPSGYSEALPSAQGFRPAPCRPSRAAP